MGKGQARSREDERVQRDGLRVIVVLMIALLCAGCSDEAEVESSGGTTETSANRKRRRSDVLGTLVEMSQPQTLRIRTRRETVVSLLNDWVSMSGGTADAEDPVDVAYTDRLDEDLVTRIRASRFSKRDVTHIRDALWYARISKLVAAPAQTDLERSTRLFYYVMRNIVLRSDEDSQLPMAPFGIAMFGEGNARDRAWLFINLLGQLRIDAVVLAATEDPARVLVGVLLAGKVYLYDPTLGLPVPAGPATAQKTFNPKRLWPIAILAGGLGLFYLFGLDTYLSFESLRDNRAVLLEYVAKHTVVSALAFALIYIVCVAFSLPGASFLTIVGGLLFGQMLGAGIAL